MSRGNGHRRGSRVVDALTPTAASEPVESSDPLVNRIAEASVIGAGLIDATSIDRVRKIINVDDFDGVQHRLIFGAMLALRDAESPIDPPLLAAELERQSSLGAAGGPDGIGYFIGLIPYAGNAEYYATLVAAMAQRRGLRTRGEALSKHAGDLAIAPLEVAQREREVLDGFVRAIESVSGNRAIRASDVREPAPLRWVIEGLWPAGEIGLFVGDGGSFKSTVAVHVTAAIANGSSLFGRFRVRQGSALIVSAEDPADLVLMRLRAFIIGHGWDLRILQNIHIIAEPDASLAEPAFRAQLSGEIARIQPAFVVLDPLAELLGGDENSNTDLRPVMKYLRSLARSSDAAIGIVHHAGKAGPDRRTLDRIRGASALASAARTILFFDFHPGGVLLTNLKNSRAPKLDPFVVERHIETAEGDRGTWTSATLTVSAMQTSAMNRGEAFVLSQLKMSPAQTTSELKRAATGTGIRNEDVSRALAALQAQSLIGYTSGPRGGKKWSVTLGQTSAHLAQRPPGNDEFPPCPPCPDVARASFDLAQNDLAPLKGARQGRWAGAGEWATSDSWEPDETQIHDSLENQ